MDVNEVVSAEKEKEFRLQLFLDILEEILREIFRKHFSVDPVELYDALFKKRVILKTFLSDNQYKLILPPSKSTNWKKFDITILANLLLNLNLCDEKELGKVKEVKEARNTAKHIASADTRKDIDALLETVKELIIYFGYTQDINEIMNVNLDNKAFEQINAIEKSCKEFNYHFFPPVANFVGREIVIEEIHQHLDMVNSERKKFGVVVCGMAGVGKTQTVRKYWTEYWKYHDNRIIWINAQTKNSIEKDFIGIAEQARLPVIVPGKNRQKPINEIVEMTYCHFTKRQSEQPQRKILLVFDNAVTIQDLEPFLPTTLNEAPFMLITSQRQDWDCQHFEIYRVDVWSKESANEFLIKSLDVNDRKDESFNVKLISLLQFHPLAMQQAVSCIRMNGNNVQDYVRLIEEEEWSNLADDMPNNRLGIESVFKTFSLCIKNLMADNKNFKAVNLLKTIAYLDGKRIEEETLQQLCNGDVLATNKAITKLHNYSLIDRECSTSGKIVTMHSLVKFTVLSLNKKEGNINSFVDPLLDMIFNQLAEKKINDREAKALHQLIYLYDQMETQHQLLLKYIGMKANVDFGEIFYSRGQLRKWMEILTSVKMIAETQMQDKDLLITVFDDIARCHLLQDEFEEALEMYYKVENAELTSSRIDHKFLLTTQRNIAQCYADLGKYEEALGLNYRVVNAGLTSPYIDHRFLLMTQYNIAGCLTNLDKHEEALELYYKVKENELKLFGIDHPSVLATQHNIACCLTNLGKYEEALELYYKVEKALLTSLHIDHPSVITTQNSTAQCLRNLDRYEEALEQYYKVEKAQLTTLHIDHQSVHLTQNKIAYCLVHLGKYDKVDLRFTKADDGMDIITAVLS